MKLQLTSPFCFRETWLSILAALQFKLQKHDITEVQNNAYKSNSIKQNKMYFSLGGA